MLFVWLVELVGAHLLSLQNPLQSFFVVLIKPERPLRMLLTYRAAKQREKMIVIPLSHLSGIVKCFSMWFAPKMSWLNVYLLKLVWFSFIPTIMWSECGFMRGFLLRVNWSVAGSSQACCCCYNKQQTHFTCWICCMKRRLQGIKAKSENRTVGIIFLSWICSVRESVRFKKLARTARSWDICRPANPLIIFNETFCLVMLCLVTR